MNKKNYIIGYEKLYEANNLDYLITLSNLLTKKKFKSKYNFFNLKGEIVELCVMQFLIQHRIDKNLNLQILDAIGNKNRLNLGLPNKWLNELEKEGFKSDTFKNKINWFCFIMFWYAVGVYIMFQTFIRGFLTKTSNSPSYVYFDNLSHNNIPSDKLQSRTIIDWYLNKFENDQIEILHNVLTQKPVTLRKTKIYPSKFPFRVNLSKVEWCKFLLEGIWIAIKSIYALIRGDFIQALLLKEYPLLILAKKTNKEMFGKKYFFHNSVRIFRPLWTYEAEQKGAEVILYYYSTNNSPLKFDKGYLNGYGNKHYMSWGRVWVWSKYQKEYLEQYIPKDKIDIVGPIWFSSNNSKLPPVKDQVKIVSIFDVQTVTEDIYKSIGPPDRYLITSNMIRFHQDIIDVLKSFKNIKVILKRKRAFTHGFHDPKYLDFLDKNYNNDKYFQIDNNIDALTLIEKSYLSISYPATSTAYLAKHHGIFSIYYDPTNKVDRYDRALSGVSLIRGKDELKDYINTTFQISH